MTLAVMGRTLPAHFGAYPATVEGVDGYVLSINGTAAFYPHRECDQIGRYLLFDRDTDTAPVNVQTSPEPQARGPVTGV